MEELAQGNRAFTFDLYKKLSTTEGNLFFSPYSISTALAMTYGGARENTEFQMASTMHFTLGQEELHPTFAALEAQLNAIGEEGKVRLLVANSIWPHQDYRFLPAYLELLKKYYGTSVTPLDYTREAEEARQTINSWVEDKTEDKIKDLIPRGVLNSQTAMVLANAIYFKGDWARQFKKEITAEAPFYLAADKTVDVPMMRQEASFKYHMGGGVQLLELPYEGRDLSMIVVLPELGKLSEIENSLTPKRLNDWIRQMVEIDVRVLLPRFKMTSQFELAPTLSDMGMFDAFDPGRADFSGMDGQKGTLFISNVIHKAFVDVNEEGTEAAAATGVVVGRASVQIPPEFNANRPFLFFIRENQTGSILFMGRVVDPTA